MKKNTLFRSLSLVAAVPFTAFAQQASEPEAPVPVVVTTASATATSTVDPTKPSDVSKITVIIEKGGQTTTHSFEADLDQLGPLPQLFLSKLTAQANAPKSTYLGVALAESNEVALPGGTSVQVGDLGVKITAVSEGSPAAAAGLLADDLVKKLDDQVLVNPAQFTALIRSKKEGDQVTLAVVRQGESKEIGVTLASRQEALPEINLSSLASFLPTTRVGEGGNDLNWLHGQILRLGKDNEIVVETLKSLADPDKAAEHLKKIGAALEPSVRHAAEEVAKAKMQAADQWKEQSAKLREQWVEAQEKAAEQYSRAAAEAAEQLRKANEAALKAQQQAAQALEEASRKLEAEAKRAQERVDAEKAAQ